MSSTFLRLPSHAGRSRQRSRKIKSWKDGETYQEEGIPTKSKGEGQVQDRDRRDQLRPSNFELNKRWKEDDRAHQTIDLSLRFPITPTAL